MTLLKKKVLGSEAMQDAANGLYGRVGHALNLSLHDDHVCVSTQKKILFVA